MKIYAPAVLRLGMVAVILWFSLQQFLHNDQYTAYVPDLVVALSHLSAGMLVFFNAVFELVFGILLAFGWQTRIVSLLLALHLFDIMYTVGYGQIGTRDFRNLAHGDVSRLYERTGCALHTAAKKSSLLAPQRSNHCKLRKRCSPYNPLIRLFDSREDFHNISLPWTQQKNYKRISA